MRTVHYDVSALNQKIGIRPTHIATPRSKVLDNEDEPLNGAARAYLQQRVRAIPVCATNAHTVRAYVRNAFLGICAN